MESVEISIGNGNQRYRATVGDGILAEIGRLVRNLPNTSGSKILLFSNETVFPIYGDTVLRGLEEAGFESAVWTIADGEQYKNFEYFSRSLDKFAEVGLGRSDVILALGGGVVGDLAGFAASVYLRGVKFIQVPTTLLSMVDSSVGSKTGINTAHGKNLVGSFYTPSAVYADISTLQTLSARELRAGYYEIIKHGAIGGIRMLELASGFLQKYPLGRFGEFAGDPGFSSDLTELIAAQVEQKAAIVEGDRLEEPTRTDGKSRKILNFGHTIGHALEKATKYSYFRHGEAVAYGMLAAADMAKKLEYCDNDSINLLNDVIRTVGELPDGRGIDIDAVLDAISFDKKAMGKVQQWVLLERIGSPRLVSGDLIERSLIRESISKALHG